MFGNSSITIWGHGGYLGPDFSAQTLHGLAMHLAGQLAQTRFQTAYANLRDTEKATVDATVASVFKTNRYDAVSGTLTLAEDGQADRVVFLHRIVPGTLRHR